MKNKGFTLVELLITMAIMATLFTVGYANYQGYLRAKQLEKGVLQFEGHLQLAQRKALSAEDTAACAAGKKLFAYRVSYSGSTYSIAAICGDTYTPNMTATTLPSLTNIALPEYLQFANAGSFEFFTVKGSTNLGGSNLTITLTRTDIAGSSVNITVKSSGEIKI